MTPDLIAEVRAALLRYVGTLAADDNADAPAELETVAALIRRLPPDPGGAMPEPDAGMRVTLAGGGRALVQYADPSLPNGTGPWWITLPGKTILPWNDAHIREIRTPDGRVLWRAKEE